MFVLIERIWLARDADIVFQLHSQKDALLQVCCAWQTDTRPVPTDQQLGSWWGPTQEELHDAATRAVTGAWDGHEMSIPLEGFQQLSESNGDSDGVAVDDSDLLDAVELADYVDFCSHVDT
jgi:hypothetical protein